MASEKRQRVQCRPELQNVMIQLKHSLLNIKEYCLELDKDRQTNTGSKLIEEFESKLKTLELMIENAKFDENDLAVKLKTMKSAEFDNIIVEIENESKENIINSPDHIPKISQSNLELFNKLPDNIKIEIPKPVELNEHVCCSLCGLCLALFIFGLALFFNLLICFNLKKTYFVQGYSRLCFVFVFFSFLFVFFLFITYSLATQTMHQIQH